MPRICGNCNQPIALGDSWNQRADGTPIHQQCPDAATRSLRAVGACLTDQPQLTDAGIRYEGAELDEEGPTFRFTSGAGEHQVRITLPEWSATPPELMARGVTNHVLLEIARRKRTDPDRARDGAP